MFTLPCAICDRTGVIEDYDGKTITCFSCLGKKEEEVSEYEYRNFYSIPDYIEL